MSTRWGLSPGYAHQLGVPLRGVTVWGVISGGGGYSPRTSCTAAATVVLTVDITKRRWKKRRTWVRPLLCSRSEVGACDLLLTQLRATDTQMYANFTRVSPAEFDFLLCAIREQIADSGRWRTGHARRQGDVIGCNNFSS